MSMDAKRGSKAALSAAAGRARPEVAMRGIPGGRKFCSCFVNAALMSTLPLKRRVTRRHRTVRTIRGGITEH